MNSDRLFSHVTIEEGHKIEVTKEWALEIYKKQLLLTLQGENIAEKERTQMMLKELRSSLGISEKEYEILKRELIRKILDSFSLLKTKF